MTFPYRACPKSRFTEILKRLTLFPFAVKFFYLQHLATLPLRQFFFLSTVLSQLCCLQSERISAQQPLRHAVCARTACIDGSCSGQDYIPLPWNKVKSSL